MASTSEAKYPAATVNATPGSSSSSRGEVKDAEAELPEFTPMYHNHHHLHGSDLEDLFRGPRDVYRHSRWPTFLRLHGSIAPKMILPLAFIGAWATLITCIHHFIHHIGINSVLLTVTGFVVGLALSFRSSTAYERFSEGRRYWAQLLLASRNLARLIWVSVKERHDASEEQGKTDLLAKLAALQLINAFAVSLKYRLRFEPSPDYPDLAPLLVSVRTLASEADTKSLKEKRLPIWKAAGQYLGIPMAEDNPRTKLKQAKDNLGNIPLEVLTYLSVYIDTCLREGTLTYPAYQTVATTSITTLTEVLTGTERVVNTPLPIAYSISISQITWAYVIALPFQLVGTLGWITIPGTILAGYIIHGLAQIGHELENPFGLDVNDLPLDNYCHELADEIDALTSVPAPASNAAWMRDGGMKVMYPLSGNEFKAWEARSVEDIRAALKAKATSADVRKTRVDTAVFSEGLTGLP